MKILKLPVYSEDKSKIILEMDIALDDEVYDEVKNMNWQLMYSANRWRVSRRFNPSKGKHREEFLHSFIWRLNNISDIPKGYSIDHIDHNPLNNQLCNLRILSQKEQIINTRPRLNKVSRYKGVHRSRTKWQTNIRLDNKRVYLGTYDTEIDAAKAYDKAAFDAYGDLAYLNFPNNTQPILGRDAT